MGFDLRFSAVLRLSVPPVVVLAFPIPRDVGDHGDLISRAAQNRRASTCHWERAAQPGVERSKSAKPPAPPSPRSIRILKGLAMVIPAVSQIGVGSRGSCLSDPDDVSAPLPPPGIPPHFTPLTPQVTPLHPRLEQLLPHLTPQSNGFADDSG